jgi:tRNA-specific adenosine deaminase 2
MCASALNIAKLYDIYYGCSNEKFGGCGSILNISENFNVKKGIFKEKCINILKEFYLLENPNNSVKPTSKKKKKIKFINRG